MCSYSMIADHFTDRWQHQYPFVTHPIVIPPADLPAVTRAEFEELRKEVSDLKALLIKARDYDVRNGEPDCEMADKVALLRKIAELVGVDLGDALPKQ